MGKDRAIAESPGIRVMTMIGSKGLTVRATIIAGLEDGIFPRPDADLGEERRLLYVAMTCAKEFLVFTLGPVNGVDRLRALAERVSAHAASRPISLLAALFTRGTAQHISSIGSCGESSTSRIPKICTAAA